MTSAPESRRAHAAFARRLACALLFFIPWLASAQTLNISNASLTYATLTNTAVTMTGRAELRITGAGDPITGCTINLNSPDAFFYMTAIQPGTVASTFLSRIFVNGAAAVLDTNVRIVQKAMGAVVIPQASGYSPLEVFDARYFAGKSKRLYPYVKYADWQLGGMKMAIRSFRLKHGYMATFAQNENGTGVSKCYVAQDGDLEVGRLPDTLADQVRFVRIFPWRWVSKKGSCDVAPADLKANWHYNWNISLNSTLDWEYVAIKQQPYWPGTDQDWKARGVNHLSGFNEPNNPVEDAYQNLTPLGSVSDAVARYPELLGTGLRVGAPAVTDGGYSWIVDFINQANAAGVRIDYVPVHYYRSTSGNNPTTAANNLYNYLKSIYDVAQRPIWVTEFNNGANWTDDAHDPNVTQNRDVIEAMVNMMDSTPWIERYAVYSNVEWFRDTHYTDGSLTPMGSMYRDHVAPIAYAQEMADAGTGNSARYDFDGNAHDSWGNGQDGLLAGTPNFAAGKYGQALQFNGTTDYVQLSPRIADTTDFTFAAWVWWNGGADWQRIFDFGLGTSNYLAFTPKAGTSGGLRFLMRDGGSEQQLNTGALATGQWVHVAVTIAGDVGKLFVNGALVNTNTAMTINPVDVDTKFNYLGKSQFADPLFNGKMDDVRIVSSALTDAQIAAMVATGPPQFSSTTLVKPGGTKLQPYTGSLAADALGGAGTRTFSKMSGPPWLAVAQDGSLTGVPTALDGGVNNFYVRVTDATGAIHATMLQVTVAEAGGMVARYAFDGNANASVGTAHGTATGSPAYATGHSGQAIDLSGTGQYVTLPAGVAEASEITVAMWFQRDSTASWQRLFDFGNGSEEYFFLSPRSATSTIRFAIKNNGTEQGIETPSQPTGTWVHVAVTLGAGTGKLYVNGALAASGAMSVKPSDILPATNYIGKSQYSAAPLFDGRIDDFVIFNTALNAAQIAALMNGHAPTFTADPMTKPGATAGTAYNQSLALNVTDPDAGSVFTFSKVSGPAWLTVGADGRLSGLPAANDVGVNRFTVRVTDQTLLADDAEVNITVSAPVAGLVAQYQFDGNTLNTAGGGAGTTTGSPTYEDGFFDKALHFDGVDDLVTLPANVVGALTDATFALRVRWDGGAAWQRIFDFGAGTAQYLLLTPSSGSGTVQFAILNSGGTVQRLAGPAALPVGEWAHVAVTLIGSTGTLYVNGAAVATTSITIDPANVTQTANYLGDSQFAADPLFAGALDDFRIYSRGLSAAEIAALALPPAPVAVLLDYAGWTTGIAFPGGQSGALANADNDLLLNIWEYFHGTNPAAGTAPPVQSIVAGNRLTLVFPRNANAGDVTVTVQGADSPAGPWTDLARSTGGGAFTVLAAGAAVSETGSGNTRSVEVRDLYDLADPAHPRRNLRLRLQQP